MPKRSPSVRFAKSNVRNRTRSRGLSAVDKLNCTLGARCAAIARGLLDLAVGLGRLIRKRFGLIISLPSMICSSTERFSSCLRSVIRCLSVSVTKIIAVFQAGDHHSLIWIRYPPGATSGYAATVFESLRRPVNIDVVNEPAQSVICTCASTSFYFLRSSARLHVLGWAKPQSRPNVVYSDL